MILSAYLRGKALEEVDAYLGRVLDDEETRQADAHLGHAVVESYVHTRGKGFTNQADGYIGDVDAALWSAIISRAVRTAANPTDLASWSSGTVNQRPGRHGWTLAELRVLDAYRQQAGSI
jgi:hypothetical protein